MKAAKVVNRNFLDRTIQWGAIAVINDYLFYRLTSDLTGFILVHDGTQAWLILCSDFDSIPPFVEGGVYQMVAYLFLSEGLPTPTKASTDGGPFEEKLR